MRTFNVRNSPRIRQKDKSNKKKITFKIQTIFDRCYCEFALVV